jgi:hypothetical protein
MLHYTYMSRHCCILYPISAQYVSNIQIEIKKWILIHRLIHIMMIFRYTPAAVLFILNVTSIRPTICLLPSLPFSSRNPAPSFSSRARRFPRGQLMCGPPHFITQLQLESSPRFPLFFKMTSCASLIEINNTRQGDIFHMHRQGDAVARAGYRAW